jgi:hypothetical protein
MSVDELRQEDIESLVNSFETETQGRVEKVKVARVESENYVVNVRLAQ